MYFDSSDNKNIINFDISSPSNKPLELHDFLYFFINNFGCLLSLTPPGLTQFILIFWFL